jgi:competence protein ComEC
VLRVGDGEHSLLLTGDAEEAAQRRLLQRPDLLRVDVLKVPHHGGNTNAPGFIDAVGATTAVVGVGRDNDYGHPHPDVLDDLEGMRVLRTDVGGTVRVTP